MKKKIFIVSLLVLVLALAITAVCLAVARYNNSKAETKAGPSPETEAPADQESWELYSAKAAEHGKNLDSGVKKDLFEDSYEIANEEQRAKLDALYEEYVGLSWEHEREIKIIMGELPEDTPRLTKEAAAEICGKVGAREYGSPEVFEGYVAYLFDQVAGAPDLNGGSGISYHTYYLDDSQEIAVRIAGGVVEYWDKTNGESEILLRLLDLMG